MKVLDADKVINLMLRVRKQLPSRNGILPQKFFSRENMDQVIERLKNESIDLEDDVAKEETNA